MARVLKGSDSFTHTPGMNYACFAFPAKAGTHLPTHRDQRLSWPWVAGWLHTEINARHRQMNPDTVAHLSTNQDRHRLTSLIEANALTTTLDHQRACVNLPADVRTALTTDSLIALADEVGLRSLNCFMHSTYQ